MSKYKYTPDDLKRDAEYMRYRERDEGMIQKDSFLMLKYLRVLRKYDYSQMVEILENALDITKNYEKEFSGPAHQLLSLPESQIALDKVY